MCILHEFGHLLNRWAGISDSPEQHLFEAGSFVEKRLFCYRINLAYLENNNHAEMKLLVNMSFASLAIISAVRCPGLLVRSDPICLRYVRGGLLLLAVPCSGRI